MHADSTSETNGRDSGAAMDGVTDMCLHDTVSLSACSGMERAFQQNLNCLPSSLNEHEAKRLNETLKAAKTDFLSMVPSKFRPKGSSAADEWSCSWWSNSGYVIIEGFLQASELASAAEKVLTK